jgi:hypothetical protein
VIGLGSIGKRLRSPPCAGASGPGPRLSLQIKRIHGLLIAAQLVPLRRVGEGAALAQPPHGFISLVMLLIPDSTLLERAWAAALPGREAAERNAVLRALLAAALERPPRPRPVLHTRR